MCTRCASRIPTVPSFGPKIPQTKEQQPDNERVAHTTGEPVMKGLRTGQFICGLVKTNVKRQINFQRPQHAKQAPAITAPNLNLRPHSVASFTTFATLRFIRHLHSSLIYVSIAAHLLAFPVIISPSAADDVFHFSSNRRSFLFHNLPPPSNQNQTSPKASSYTHRSPWNG